MKQDILNERGKEPIQVSDTTTNNQNDTLEKYTCDFVDYMKTIVTRSGVSTLSFGRYKKRKFRADESVEHIAANVEETIRQSRAMQK